MQRTSALQSPDRWLLWLGVLFVLSVYYFPTGVVRALAGRKAGEKVMNPTSNFYITCAGREIHYMKWGAEHQADA